MHSPFNLSGARSLLFLARALPALLWAPLPVDGAETPVPNVSSPSGQFELFSGLDLSAEHEGKMLPVVDVTGERLYLKQEREVKQIPFWKVKSYRMQPVLKLSEIVAEVTNFKATPDYMPETDPRAKWMRAQNQMYIQQTNRMEDQRLEVQLTPNKLPEKATSGPTLQSAAIQKWAKKIENDSSLTGDLSNSGWYNNKMQQELDEERYDALVFDFTLASNKYIHEPYIVIITTGRAPDHPDQEFDSIYAKSLESIASSKPRSFHIRQNGLPPGYKLARTQFHLYSGNQEIATSLSEKRLSLTKDQAVQYLIVQYVVDHKTETLPAKPALIKFPSDFSTKISPEQLKQRFVLTIDSSGSVTKVALLDEGNRPVDEYAESVMKSFYFYPALLKGKPVEGQLKVRFSDLR